MSSDSKKVIYAALAGNTLIALSKFGGAFFTGSSAMLSEGIHSLVDTGNQILLLYGIKKAQKPASTKFPFGHGKEIYFWSFVVAILIFALGAGISVYEGIHHILQPNPIQDPRVNYIILGLSFLFEGGACLMALKEFKKYKGNKGFFEAIKTSKNPNIFVVLFEDSAALLGLLFAFLGIFLGQITSNPYWDGAASICIGGILGSTAIWLAIETKGLLIGESADPEMNTKIKSLLLEQKEIESLNELATLHMGPEYILLTCSLDFSDLLNAQDIEHFVNRMESEIQSQFPLIKKIFIEAQSFMKLSPPTSQI